MQVAFTLPAFGCSPVAVAGGGFGPGPSSPIHIYESPSSARQAVCGASRGGLAEVCLVGVFQACDTKLWVFECRTSVAGGVRCVWASKQLWVGSLCGRRGSLFCVGTPHISHTVCAHTASVVRCPLRRRRAAAADGKCRRGPNTCNFRNTFQTGRNARPVALARRQRMGWSQLSRWRRPMC